MMGRSTAGHKVSGVVLEILPGMCFRVDTGVQISLLWKELALLEPELEPETESDSDADADDEGYEGGPPPPVPIRRTDSGADYSAEGYPDCEFWERQGVEPLYVATASHYSDMPRDNTHIVRLLVDAREQAAAAGGAYVRAWQRQMDESMHGFATPPRSPSTSECPGAPNRNRVRRSASLSVHRGHGILVGDFIKPDPALTRRETRAYLLGEMERWLGGRIRDHALEIADAGLTVADVEDEVQSGLWPAGRLFMLTSLLKSAGKIPSEGRPVDHVARWVANTIRRCVEGEDEGMFESAAMEFWRTDLLGDRTIDSLWDSSPFDALREADELPNVDPYTFSTFLQEDHTATLPGWAIVGMGAAVMAYLWSVAAAISMCRS